MTKSEIRQKVWQSIQREGVARFPGALGRIPNFAGAEKAAQLLREMAVWRRALVVKVNPDAPQLSVRRLALSEGKILYMAVPRLRTEKCFARSIPAPREEGGARGQHRGRLSLRPRVSRARDATRRPRRVRIGCGRSRWCRIGKGGGYCDLEYGLLRGKARSASRTPLLTRCTRCRSWRGISMPPARSAGRLWSRGAVSATRPAHPRPRGITGICCGAQDQRDPLSASGSSVGNRYAFAASTLSIGQCAVLPVRRVRWRRASARAWRTASRGVWAGVTPGTSLQAPSTTTGTICSRRVIWPRGRP